MPQNYQSRRNYRILLSVKGIQYYNIGYLCTVRDRYVGQKQCDIFLSRVLTKPTQIFINMYIVFFVHFGSRQNRLLFRNLEIKRENGSSPFNVVLVIIIIKSYLFEQIPSEDALKENCKIPNSVRYGVRLSLRNRIFIFDAGPLLLFEFLVRGSRLPRGQSYTMAREAKVHVHATKTISRCPYRNVHDSRTVLA